MPRCFSLVITSVDHKVFVTWAITVIIMTNGFVWIWRMTQGEGLNWPKTHAHTHTHTRLTDVCPWLPGWAGTRKVKPVWILLKQETVSGSGISWAICKSAPRSKQITTPSPHYSVFLQAGCPSCCPTNSVKALKAKIDQKHCATITDWPLSQIVNCSCSVCFSMPLERVKCVCIFYLQLVFCFVLFIILISGATSDPSMQIEVLPESWRRPSL